MSQVEVGKSVSVGNLCGAPLAGCVSYNRSAHVDKCYYLAGDGKSPDYFFQMNHMNSSLEGLVSPLIALL